jgi:methyl-accepting chemotaxis protein
VQAKGSRSVLKSVNDSASAMKSTATDLFAASEQTSQRAYGMVQASNEASMNVGNAANATDELSASITEISRQIGQTIDVVLTAVNKAKAMSDRFAGLVRAAQMIGEVVKLIQQIAAQTNLLALNASGSAGRRSRTRLCGGGFRGEIARFANGQCDEEIAGQIQVVQSSTTEAVDTIRSIEECVGQINLYASGIAASVEQQAKATQEISHNVVNASRETKSVVSVLGEFANSAVAVRASAEIVLTASQSVESAIGNLRDEVESFLSSVAA